MRPLDGGIASPRCQQFDPNLLYGRYMGGLHHRAASRSILMKLGFVMRMQDLFADVGGMRAKGGGGGTE